MQCTQDNLHDTGSGNIWASHWLSASGPCGDPTLPESDSHPAPRQTPSQLPGLRRAVVCLCFPRACLRGISEGQFPRQGPWVCMKSNQCCWWEDIKKKSLIPMGPRELNPLNRPKSSSSLIKQGSILQACRMADSQGRLGASSWASKTCVFLYMGVYAI